MSRRGTRHHRVFEVQRRFSVCSLHFTISSTGNTQGYAILGSSPVQQIAASSIHTPKDQSSTRVKKDVSQRLFKIRSRREEMRPRLCIQTRTHTRCARRRRECECRRANACARVNSLSAKRREILRAKYKYTRVQILRAYINYNHLSIRQWCELSLRLSSSRTSHSPAQAAAV